MASVHSVLCRQAASSMVLKWPDPFLSRDFHTMTDEVIATFQLKGPITRLVVDMTDSQSS